MSVKNTLVLLLLLLGSSAAGTTYYIDPSGNNSNDGSSSNPWKTLAYACSKATVSGDIIHVNSGTYLETSQSRLAIGVSIEGDGETSVIQSYINEPIFTIVLSSPLQGMKGNQHISYIKMDGSELAAYGAIKIDRRSNVKIYNCVFTDFNYYGVGFDGDGTGNQPSAYATGNEFHDNKVFNCSGYFPAGEKIVGEGKYGLGVNGQDGLLIYNNTIDQTSRQPGSNGYCIKGVSGYNKNVKIYNNKIYKAPYDNLTWDFAIELWECRGGVEIYNNVISAGVDVSGSIYVPGISTQEGSFSYSVWIHDNIIGQENLSKYNSCYGVLIEQSATDVYIERNYIKNVYIGIFFPLEPKVNQTGKSLDNIYVRHNILNNIGVADGGAYSPGYGISFPSKLYDYVCDNVNITNNTIISSTGTIPNYYGIMLPSIGTSTNITVRNNIIQGFYGAPVFGQGGSGRTLDGLSIENNIFYKNGNSNLPMYRDLTPTNNTTRNNIISNPLFISSSDYHLLPGSPAISNGIKIPGETTDYEGNILNDPPCIGAYEFYTSGVPVYQSSVVENASPSLLELSFNRILASVVPDKSAFNVMVNSVSRNINSVAISVNKVQLTLESKIKFGDVVTISYTKPENNPLQNVSGEIVESLSSKPVTNNCAPTIPVYSSSVIENTTPSLLVMTYSLNLANIVPAASAFSVLVNSVVRNVTSVAISGTKIQLTLERAIKYGDIVTVSYTKPEINPLQNPSGEEVASIGTRSVNNKCISTLPVYSSSVVENATPLLLAMYFSFNLASIVPASSAFSVKVNSVVRNVTSVAISGARVQLTLGSAIKFGDIVTVSYTKPEINPLQNVPGEIVSNISTKPVTNNCAPTIPVYSSSAIEDAAPSLLVMTYSLNLANIVPAASAFSVLVNSVPRNVISTAISGTKIQLTLESAIKFGDIVTVSYTKPAINPLQNTLGEVVADISKKSVTNNCNPTLPVYYSSVVEDATPALLEMTFNISLVNIVPANSSFNVMVNSVPRNVISVTISGTKVKLTLESAIKFGDIITVTYRKPATNPLQGSSGEQVESFSSRSVTNNCKDLIKTNSPPIIVADHPMNVYEGFISRIDASSTYDPNNDPLLFDWIIPGNISVSTVKSLKTEFLAPIVKNSTVINYELSVSDGKIRVTNDFPIIIQPYKPELAAARITKVIASDFQTKDYPGNVIDDNISTKWSSNGNNPWLLLKLAQPFKISHLMLAFLQGQKFGSCFDIYASKNNIVWEYILTATSCTFSGERQIFDFPESKTNTEYSYIKYVGHGNSVDSQNNVSEIKIFGRAQKITNENKAGDFVIYPNPAKDFFYISIENFTINPNSIRIIDLSGKVVFEDTFDQIMNRIQLPSAIHSGIYIVELRLGTLIVCTQKLVIKN